MSTFMKCDIISKNSNHNIDSYKSEKGVQMFDVIYPSNSY